MRAPQRLWIILCAFLAAPAGWANQLPDSIVLISIDGLRPDAITPNGMPRLHAALQHSIYTLQAQNVLPSLTLPNHLSMLSGLSGAEHGVRWNHSRPGQYDGKTLFHAVATAGGRSAAFVAKRKLRWLLDPDVVERRHIEPKPDADQLFRGESAANIVDAFAATWHQGRYDFSLIHICEPDSAGHDYGWMSPEYLQAVRLADRALGDVLEQLDLGHTAVIVTADHGGSEAHHQVDLEENRTIPWIALLPGIGRQIVIEQPVRIHDTAPTIAALLGVGWLQGGSGRVVDEVVDFDAVKRYFPPARDMSPVAGLPETVSESP